MTECNEHLQVKMFGIQGMLCGLLDHTKSSLLRIFLFGFVVCVCLVGWLVDFAFKFCFGEGCMGRG